MGNGDVKPVERVKLPSVKQEQGLGNSVQLLETRIKMSWTNERDKYQKLAESIEPVSKVVTKDHWIWSAIWWVGAVLTFGLLALGLSRRRFLKDFATTVVTYQGYNSEWPYLTSRLITHESRHVTQYTWFGWILFPVALIDRKLRAWIGAPFYTIAYALLPLPIGLAACRFYLELDADKAAWGAGLRDGSLSIADVQKHAKYRAKSLSSGSYFWAWPKSWAEKAYHNAVDTVVAAHLWDKR